MGLERMGGAMKAIFAALLGTALLSTPVLAQQVQTGRYVILFSPLRGAATFLLDTATGKVWQDSTFTALNGKPEAWDYMQRLDTPQEEQAFMRQYGNAPSTTLPAPAATTL